MPTSESGAAARVALPRGSAKALDAFLLRPVGSRHRLGDPSIPGPSEPLYDFDRLERAVSVLVERQRALREENQRLVRELSERDRRIGKLESQVRELNQLRQDVAKRIDDLIGQIDQVEAHCLPRAD